MSWRGALLELRYAYVPAKPVLRATDVLTEVREAADFGVTVTEPGIDFDAFIRSQGASDEGIIAAEDAAGLSGVTDASRTLRCLRPTGCTVTD